jgi:glucose uptake protein GlcU
MVMMPALMMVMPAMVVMTRHDHMRRDHVVVTMITPGLVVMTMVTMLDENQRAGIFRRDTLIDRAGA